MMLRRKYGNGYAALVQDPAATLQALRERKEAKKDIKSIRKVLFTLLSLMDDCDLEDSERAHVFRGFQNTLETLPEAQGFLNAKTTGTTV
ncbi:MAG: hypothetical protein ABSB35_38450 [Bryobacteraceae bacterium]